MPRSRFWRRLEHALAGGAIVRWGLVALIVFTPLAFGTVEGWSIALLEWGIVSLVLAAGAARALRPAEPGAPRWRLGVEWPLGLYLGLVLLQLIPLPAAAIGPLAPGARRAHATAATPPAGGVATPSDFASLRTRLDLDAGPGFRPISVNSGETLAKGRMLAVLIALFVLVAAWAATAERALFLVRSVLITGFGVALFGIVQHLTWNGKLYWLRPSPREGGFGPFVNHNHFAGYVEMILPLAIAMAYYLLDLRRRRAPDPPVDPEDSGETLNASLLDDRQSAAERWGLWVLALFAAVILLGSLLLSQSRGGMLSATLSSGLLFLALWRRIQPRALAWIGAAALPILAALLAVWIGADLFRVAEPSHSVEREASFHSRWVIWKEIGRRLPEAGALGFGLGTFEESFAPYTPRGTAQRWDRAHNDYLQIAWETGVIGMLLIAWGGLAFAWRYGKAALKSPAHPLDLFRVAIAVALASLLLHSVVDFNLQIGSNAFLFALLAGLLVAIHRIVERDAAAASPLEEAAGQGLRLHLASEPRILGGNPEGGVEGGP